MGGRRATWPCSDDPRSMRSSRRARHAMLVVGTSHSGTTESVVSRTSHPGIQRLSDGRYHIRVKATCPRTGKMVTKKETMEACSISEAVLKREAMRQSIERGPEVSRTRQRLEAAVRLWLSSRLPSLRPSTRVKYAVVIDLHIVPALGDIYVDKLRSSDITAWRDAQCRIARPSTVNSRLQLLRTILADLCAELSIPSPAARVRGVRRGYDDANESKSLSAAELEHVLAELRDHHPNWYPIFATLAWTGMRVGEATALRWSDVDFERGVIKVVRSHYRGIVDDTKTGVRREVALTPHLAEVLRAHRAEIETKRDAEANDYVFLSSVETLVMGPSLRKPLLDALKRAGIKRRFTVHGFRHSFNNLLRQLTTGEIVRSMTGHVTEAMTNHYSHVSDEEKLAVVIQLSDRVAAAKVSREVSRQAESENAQKSRLLN